MNEKKKIYPIVLQNEQGYWAYVDLYQFYIETKEYVCPNNAIAALERILDSERFEVIKETPTNEA